MTKRIPVLLAILLAVTLVWADQERMIPQTLAEQSGFVSCSVGDLDEDPDSPDSNWCVASTNNTSVSARATFNTPANPTTDGTDLQECRCHFKANDDCGTGCADAYVSWYILGTQQEITAPMELGASGSGCTNEGTLTAGILWDATGVNDDNVQCRCSVNKSGGSPTTRCSGDVGAVEWNADTTAAGGRRFMITEDRDETVPDAAFYEGTPPVGRSRRMF